MDFTGAYASWFTTQVGATPTTGPSLLMNAISYIVTSLPDMALCLPAANALRDLCDANREALAPHIGAFASLHAGLTDIPVCIFFGTACSFYVRILIAWFR
jgi:hypothetical protein